MTWTKLSDDFSDDCETLDDDAFRFHVEGLVWSNRKLLDCRIPKDHLRRFATNPQALDKVLEVGWWTDDGDAYVIVHHAVYQRSRDDVLAQQQRNRANGMKGGRPPGPPRERAPRKRPNNPPGLATGLANGKATGIEEDSNSQDKTQVGNPVANPEGRAGRSSKRNHPPEELPYLGPCQKCEDAQALGSEARSDENQCWCGSCNDELKARIQRARAQS